jgi:REP-associated tyrosine transposase
VEFFNRPVSPWFPDDTSIQPPQGGFSVFSVSASIAPTVSTYIENQEAHHRRMSFEEELCALLEKHGVEFDSEHYLD